MVRPPTKHILSSQNGLSLIESLIAVAMLSMFIGLSATYTNLFKAAPTSLRRACMAHAQTVLNVVQEQTYYRQIMNFIPHEGGVGNNGNRRISGFAATPGYPDRVITNPGDYMSGSPGDFAVSIYPYSSNPVVPGPALQNSQLIQGSMRALATIWNTQGSVRCNFGTYPSLTDLPLSAEMQRLSPTPNTRIKIRPYTRLDGNDLCVGSNIYPGPEPNQPWDGVVTGRGNLPVNNEKYDFGAPGPASSPGGAYPGPVAFFQRGVTGTNMGIELTVATTYVPDPLNSPGVTDTCTVSHKFEYPADTTAPQPPDIIRVVPGSNQTKPTGPDNCQPNNPPSVSVELGFQNETMEQGTQLLCHDLSWMKVWDVIPLTPPYSFNSCVRAGVIDPGIPGQHGSENRGLQRFSNARDHWVPCDQLVQCSKRPASVQYIVTGGPGAGNTTPAPGGVTGGTDPDTLMRQLPNISSASHLLRLNYDNLPYGCDLNFEVVAVDTAGNVSALAAPGARKLLVTNGGNTYDSPSDDNTKIVQNTCDLVPPGGTNHCLPSMPFFDAISFPNGYYTCRIGGCCVGVGCAFNSGPF